MYRIIRPLLFALPAETSHNMAVAAMAGVAKSRVLCAILQKLYRSSALNRPVKAMGLTFPNAVGLAAGLDKHGLAGDALASFGFGFIEQGTVTPLPQDGNPRPRLFRVVDEQALINRMGFNSVGVERFVANIAGSRGGFIRGINIGKNAATPMPRAVDDYLAGLRRVYQAADYIAINISSPNTRDLRDLHQPEALEPLLKTLDAERNRLAARKQAPIPLAVKVSPDLTAQEVDDMARLLRKYNIDAVIATNTTITHRHRDGRGGLSGLPLAARSTHIVRLLYEHLQGEIPIIGVGGIMDAAQAQEKIAAGAVLIQLYTGLIYHGPGLVRAITLRL